VKTSLETLVKLSAHTGWAGGWEQVARAAIESELLLLSLCRLQRAARTHTVCTRSGAKGLKVFSENVALR
jgi:hypothetical protein